MTDIPNSIVRLNARTSLKGQYTPCIAALLLSQVISIIASSIFLQDGGSEQAGLLYSFSSVILLLLTGVISAGFCFLYLQIARSRSAVVTDIFFGFRNHGNNALTAILLLSLINIVLFLPFFAALYFLADVRINVQLDLFLPLRYAGRILLMFLLWIITAFFFNVRYALTFFVYADDPRKSGLTCLREGRELVCGEGHYRQLAKLELSFAGYLLLGLFSFGIGLLWVLPYLNVSLAHFYLNAKMQADQNRFDAMGAGKTQFQSTQSSPDPFESSTKDPVDHDAVFGPHGDDSSEN